MSGSSNSSSGKVCCGYVYLSLVVVIWVGSAILIQLVFSSKQSSFDKPFFLTFTNTTFFTFYLLQLCFCRPR